MPKAKSRVTANAADTATMSVNERILKECHTLYTDPDNGLICIAQRLGLKLLPPRKKITILLVGNHSAGKSSFINWYIEEHVQKTGVAIETQGFTFVTSGRKRESLTGNATLHLYPHFKPLQEIEGLVDYIGTEISSSKQKKFSLVTFVDTPGLVDGGMKYPFDVNQAILWLGDLADLIFVFFDPIGQALCKRTLDIVEKLNESHSDRLRFYLSKADEAGHESDRQRVMMQIVQELCKRPGLNKQGFDMPTIYIPNANKAVRCANQIEEVCKDVEKTINQTIQTTLNTVEKDCERISKLIDERLQSNSENSAHNMRALARSIILGSLSIVLPILCIIAFVASNLARETLLGIVPEVLVEFIHTYLSPVWSIVPAESQIETLAVILCVSILVMLLTRWLIHTRPTLSKRQKKQLQAVREYVQEQVKNKKRGLYEEYLQQSVAEQDL